MISLNRSYLKTQNFSLFLQIQKSEEKISAKKKEEMRVNLQNQFCTAPVFPFMIHTRISKPDFKEPSSQISKPSSRKTDSWEPSLNLFELINSRVFQCLQNLSSSSPRFLLFPCLLSKARCGDWTSDRPPKTFLKRARVQGWSKKNSGKVAAF